MAAKYLGGAWIMNVPARDLTDDEVEKYGAIIAAEELATGTKLYNVEKVKKAAPRKDDQ